MTYGGKGFGVGGSTHDDYNYPDVPYSSTDFNCPLGKCGTDRCKIWKYDVADEVPKNLLLFQGSNDHVLNV